MISQLISKMKTDADFEALGNISSILIEIISKSGNYNKCAVIEKQIFTETLALLDTMNKDSSNKFVFSLMSILGSIINELNERWVILMTNIRDHILKRDQIQI